MRAVVAVVGGWLRGSSARRWVASVLSIALVSGVVYAVAPRSLVGAAGSAPAAPAAVAVKNVAAVRPRKISVPDGTKKSYQATHTTFPGAASGTVALPASIGREVEVPGTPVWAQRVTRGAGPGGVAAVVMSQKAARKLGVAGVVFAVSGVSGVGKVRIGLSYKAFAQAYGGNFGSRLALYTLPACALTTPRIAACRKRTPLAGAGNDVVGQSVSGMVTVPVFGTGSAGAPGSMLASPSNVVLAASASTGEEGAAAGNYAASKISPDGTWTAGGSSGGFTYSYAITTPAASSSLTPKVGLSYDSSMVDGKTSMTNAQASWVGDGWASPANNFITQTFTSCADDPEGTASPSITGDMCYDGNLLSLSLNGSTTSIVDDNGVYRLQSNDGAVISHVTGSNNGTGTYNTDYWVVTERDGTSYYFGRNQLPGWSLGDATTNSVDYEPVYSAHAGDPCYSSSGFAASVCDMAYEWHLDYVVDTHGDAMSYWYTQATNYYGENNGANDVAYIRDSYLNYIDYGYTTATGSFGTIPDKVLFTASTRCVSSTCAPLSSSMSTSTAASEYPDVPTDLLCASGQTCTSYSPSFFSTVRLTAISTQQYSVSAAAYQPVDSYTLTQDFPATGDSTSGTLWLESIQRTGQDTSAGGSTAPISEPSVTFSGTDLPNRLDTATYPGLYRWRIAAVTSELGSVTSVSYGIPDACSTSTSPSANTTSCYPVYWTPPGYTAPIEDWFIKYAVTAVQVADTTGGAPTEVTQYQYAAPAWHYDDNPAVKAKYRTYGEFRGYQSVTTLTGDGVTNAQDKSATTYYQGMDGDYLTATTTSSVFLTDSQGGSHEDFRALAGEPLEQTTFVGDSATVADSTIYSYWVSPAVATETISGLPNLTANMVQTAEVWSRQRTTDGGAIGWRYAETDDSYDTAPSDANFGLLEYQYKHADTSTALDNPAYATCSAYTYAPVNTGENLVGLVASHTTVSVPCAGFAEGTITSVPSGLNTLTGLGSFTQAQVISATQMFYDDPSFSEAFPQTAAPSVGNVTQVLEATGYTGGAFTWQVKSRATYDGYGRVEDAYDPDLHETVTGYTVNSVGLTTGQSVTNALGQTTTETLDPTRSLVLTLTDPNGIVTTKQYDALGRVTAEWGFSRATSSPANYLYSYTESDTSVSGTVTQKMNDELGYTETVTLLDSLGRTRQVQSNTPAGGMLVTDTFYNSLGQVSEKDNAWWDSSVSPSMNLVAGAQNQIPNEDVYVYDGLGRQVEDLSEDDAAVVSTTYTVYSGDATTVIPPTGGVTKTTETDPLGRTTALLEYSTAPTLTIPSNVNTGIFTITGGTALTTSYGYDGHGNKATTTDPDGQTWTSVYNLLGQVSETEDPTGGNSFMTYDAAGNLLQSLDANGDYLSYTYDALGRKTGEYAAPLTSQVAGASGNQLAGWVYDNANNAVTGMLHPIGHLTTQVSYSGGNAYTKQFRGFNVFGESSGEVYTLGAGAGNLAGSYTFLHTYSTYTGLPLRDVYSAAGSGALPSETVVHGYTSAFDLPTSLGSTYGYAQQVVYDAYGRVSQEEIGSPTYGESWVNNTYDPHTGRLTSQSVTRGSLTPSAVDSTTYSYDLYGNITSQTEQRFGSGSDSETQCFVYDALDRLTSAWSATDACATAPTSSSYAMVGNTLGTGSAYWTSWTYNNEGDRLTRDRHSLSASSADAVTSYGYSTAQPHTLVSTSTTGGVTGSTSYAYDAVGNMTARTTAAQGSQSMTWNSASELTQVVSTTAGTTGYVYSASGNLLVQSTPAGVTVYLEGEQLTYTTASAAYSGVRYYPLPGGGTAVRTGGGTGYDFELSDQHGTNDLYLDYTAQAPTWRQFGPYGTPRGTAVAWVDNRGFLNKVNDATTGLTDIGARWYDPTIGRFISLDPILETADPLALGGYAYTDDNPITASDPSGLMLPAPSCGQPGAPTCSGGGSSGGGPSGSGSSGGGPSGSGPGGGGSSGGGSSGGGPGGGSSGGGSSGSGSGILHSISHTIIPSINIFRSRSCGLLNNVTCMAQFDIAAHTVSSGGFCIFGHNANGSCNGDGVVSGALSGGFWLNRLRGAFFYGARFGEVGAAGGAVVGGLVGGLAGDGVGALPGAAAGSSSIGVIWFGIGAVYGFFKGSSSFF